MPRPHRLRCAICNRLRKLEDMDHAGGAFGMCDVCDTNTEKIRKELKCIAKKKDNRVLLNYRPSILRNFTNDSKYVKFTFKEVDCAIDNKPRPSKYQKNW